MRIMLPEGCAQNENFIQDAASPSPYLSQFHLRVEQMNNEYSINFVTIYEILCFFSKLLQNFCCYFWTFNKFLTTNIHEKSQILFGFPNFTV